MGIIYAVSLFVANCIAWILFVRIYASKNNPQKILSGIREEVDKLLIEISRETDRDISIIEDRTARLKELIAKADEIVSLAATEQEKRTHEQHVLQSLHETGARKPLSVNPVRRAAELYTGAQLELPVMPESSVAADQTAAGESSVAPDLAAMPEPAAAPVRSATPESAVLPVETAPAEKSVLTPESAARSGMFAVTHEVPEAPDGKKVSVRSLKEQVLELARNGYSPDEISRRIGASMTEVSLILDMFGA